MQFKIISFQPAPLYENGGAGRVLRRLYEGHEKSVTTLYVKNDSNEIRKGPIKEVAVSIYPFQKKWMRWRLRTLGIYLREKTFLKSKMKKIVKASNQIQFDIIHVINHGPYCTAFCSGSFSDKPLWVSFHDHFSTCSSFEDANKLWHLADRRLMISRELGLEYQKLFGEKKFEIITDGVMLSEISVPKEIVKSPISIYFAGLLHRDYLPLFRVLADALDALVKNGYVFKLILRGTQSIDFLNERSFEIEYRTDFVSDEEIKSELDASDILYLPIKFTLPDFYLYSLSTKMVGYLGAAGAILYHGPEDSAACNLLREYDASGNCTSHEVREMEESIISLLDRIPSTSVNAKVLARAHFDFNKIKSHFWNN